RGRPEEGIAVVAGRGGGIEVDRGQPAHAGVDPVHPAPAGQQGGQLGLPGGDPLQGRRGEGQAFAAPGHRLNRLPGQVGGTGQGDHWRSTVRAVWLSEDVDMVAPPACAWAVDTLRGSLPHYATTFGSGAQRTGGGSLSGSNP